MVAEINVLILALDTLSAGAEQCVPDIRLFSVVARVAPAKAVVDIVVLRD